MTDIVIVGDSFGVPWNVNPPEYHTEYLLKELGYNVTNLSVAGTGNRQHMLKLLNYSLSNKAPDFIVWFHNNSYANVMLWDTKDSTETRSFSQEFEIANITAYNMALNLKNKFKCPWYVIGGAGFLPDIFFKYNIHDEFINCWRSQILNDDLPALPIYSYTLDTRYILHELNSDSTEYKNYLIKHAKIISDKLKGEKELFPDGHHPGIQPHVKLTMTIHEWIKKHKYKDLTLCT